MKKRLGPSKLAALAAATIMLGATPALARDGPATHSTTAMERGGALSSSSFFHLTHFAGLGWRHGGGRDEDGHGHGGGDWDHGGGWGRGGGRGHGHGDGWHGGGHPCSPG